MSIKVNHFLAPLVSISFLASFAPLVQAREIKTQEDYQLYCGAGAYQYSIQNPDCLQFREVFKDKQQSEQKEFLFEPKRKNIEQKQKQESKKKTSGYIGTSIGIYNGPQYDGVGGSIFGGVKFNHFLGLDLELGIFYDNEHFNWFSFLNPRFFIPLSKENKHLAIYISPGIGIARLAEKSSSSLGDAHLTWQIKGGIAIPIYKRLGGYGEIRYANQFSDEGSDLSSTELGLTLRL